MVEVKGSIVNEYIIAVKKRVGDQIYNTIISQLDDRSRLLFEKPISDTDWFSLDAYVNFLELDIKLTANGDENVLINRAETLIEKLFKGIFWIFVKLASPESFLRYHAIAHQDYFRGISIKRKCDEQNGAIITYTGFEKQQKLIGLLIIGFYRKALETLGAKDTHVQFLTRIEDDKGYSELKIMWKDK